MSFPQIVVDRNVGPLGIPGGTGTGTDLGPSAESIRNGSNDSAPETLGVEDFIVARAWVLNHVQDKTALFGATVDVGDRSARTVHRCGAATHANTWKRIVERGRFLSLERVGRPAD